MQYVQGRLLFKRSAYLLYLEVKLSTGYIRRQTCRGCGGTSFELVMPMAATPPADAYISVERLDETQQVYPLDLFFCNDCGLVQLLDVVAPDILYGNFIYVTSGSLGLVEHYHRYAGEVLDRFNIPKDSLIIEIGSNDGVLLKFFCDEGMRVLGVDPARAIALEATRRGIETLPRFFTSEFGKTLRKERGPSAMVVANMVFANIDDLDDMIKGVRELLAADGVFVFETGYLVDLVQKGVFDNIYHEHLSYFSVKSLNAFFSRNGMELIHVRREPSKGGAIRGTVQRKEGHREVDSSVSELIDLEERLGFDRADTFKDFAKKIDDVKIELHKLLSDLKSQGKTIAGYGASHSVTTMLYHLDLSQWIDFLVDDNPVKINTYSPGYHIPVMDSRAIYDKKPDYVVILPWRFSEAIIGKHQGYLEKGGRFIMPLPQVELI